MIYENGIPVLISLDKTKTEVLHNDEPCRVVFYPDRLQIGCHCITREAADLIWGAFERAMPAKIVFSHGKKNGGGM